MYLRVGKYGEYGFNIENIKVFTTFIFQNL